MDFKKATETTKVVIFKSDIIATSVKSTFSKCLLRKDNIINSIENLKNYKPQINS